VEPNDAGDSRKHRDALLALRSVTDRQTDGYFSCKN